MYEREMVTIDIVMTGLDSGKTTKINVPRSEAPNVYVDYPPVEYFMMDGIGISNKSPTIHFDFVPLRERPDDHLYTVTEDV
jgi:hypothetical protein